MGMERRKIFFLASNPPNPLSQSQGSRVIRDVFSFHPCLRNSCFCISMQDGREPAVLWGYFGRTSSQRPLLPFPDCFPNVVCSRKPSLVCYPLAAQGGELDLLTLSVMHLDMVTSISHWRRLFSAAQVRGALWGGWRRRRGTGRWLLVSPGEEVLITVAILTFSCPDILCQLFYSPRRTHMTQLASQQVPCKIYSPHWPLFTIPPSSSSPAPSRLGAANSFPLFMRHLLAFLVQPFSFSL